MRHFWILKNPYVPYTLVIHTIENQKIKTGVFLVGVVWVPISTMVSSDAVWGFLYYHILRCSLHAGLSQGTLSGGLSPCFKQSSEGGLASTDQAPVKC